ncbi:hypothetical protein YERSI8AC_80008 [Enterobacterales bacterium 8AC]|nr:hypothetical protein YERSI8AC_80008 [Enterobacterales bacterium 8AC]
MFHEYYKVEVGVLVFYLIIQLRG